jgi:hypothetical protein
MRMKAIVKSWLISAGRVCVQFMGSIIPNGPLFGAALTAPTFGASIAVDLSLGNNFAFTATSNAAHALANPTNGAVPVTGACAVFSVTEKNASGGAIATMTFGTAYKLGAAWTAPADTKQRTIWFLWDGTTAWEVNRTAADVAN